MRRTNQLVEVLPVVLSHEAKSTQHRPTEVVEVGKTVVRVFTRPQAHAIFWTFTVKKQ